MLEGGIAVCFQLDITGIKKHFEKHITRSPMAVLGRKKKEI